MRFHRVETVRRMPHPGRGFTQGLVLDGDLVWESTGQYGESSLRRYRLGAEDLDWSAPLPDELFGETPKFWPHTRVVPFHYPHPVTGAPWK